MRKTGLLIMVFSLALGGGSALWAQGAMKVHSVDVYAQNMYPAGVYAEYLSTSIGAGARLNIAITPVPELLPFVALEYGYGLSSDERVGSFQELGVTIGAGWAFALSPRLTVVPELGYGMLSHLLNADLEESGVKSLSAYVDQYVRFGARALFAMNGALSLSASPSLYWFTEQEYSGFLLGFQLGARIAL